jgi:hypothetical protein
MKKIIVALGLVFALSPAFAQNTANTQSGETRKHAGRYANLSKEEKAKLHADRLQKKLNLTADQHTKILAVNLEVMKRKEALKAADAKPDKAAFREIRQYRQQQFKAILTPAQMEQLKAMRAEHKKKHKDGKKGAWFNNRGAAAEPAKAAE